MGTKSETDLRAAIVAYNADPRATGRRDELIAASDGLQCFVLVGGKIDVEKSVRAYRFVVDTGSPARNAVLLEEVAESIAPVYEADPISGEPLDEGVTTSDPFVDWNGVPRERRLVAAYAAQTGRLPPQMTSELAAAALGKRTLEAPWDRLEREWITQRDGANNAQQKILNTLIEDRLVFQKQDTSARAPSMAVAILDEPAINLRPLDTHDFRDLTAAIEDAFRSVRDLARLVSLEIGRAHV